MTAAGAFLQAAGGVDCGVADWVESMDHGQIDLRTDGGGKITPVSQSAAIDNERSCKTYDDDSCSLASL